MLIFGDADLKINSVRCINIKLVAKPSGGDINKAKRILNNPSKFITSGPTDKMAAPSKPPTSAWDEEDGIPRYQVIKFQVIADNTAAVMTTSVTAEGSMRSLPIASATATPNKKGAIKCANAVRYKATLGRSARDEITVATMLEES